MMGPVVSDLVGRLLNSLTSIVNFAANVLPAEGPLSRVGGWDVNAQLLAIGAAYNGASVLLALGFLGYLAVHFGLLGRPERVMAPYTRLSPSLASVQNLFDVFSVVTVLLYVVNANSLFSAAMSLITTILAYERAARARALSLSTHRRRRLRARPIVSRARARRRSAPEPSLSSPFSPALSLARYKIADDTRAQPRVEPWMLRDDASFSDAASLEQVLLTVGPNVSAKMLEACTILGEGGLELNSRRELVEAIITDAKRALALAEDLREKYKAPGCAEPRGGGQRGPAKLRALLDNAVRMPRASS